MTPHPHLTTAQDTLNRHATSSATGRCLTCDIPGPCIHRSTAILTFHQLHHLPHRLPGNTRPQLIGARRTPTLEHPPH